MLNDLAEAMKALDGKKEKIETEMRAAACSGASRASSSLQDLKRPCGGGGSIPRWSAGKPQVW